MNIITSKSNNVIKNAKKLHQKKYRTDSYLIEGWHLFEEAVENQAKIRQVFVLEAYLDRVEDIQKVTVVTPEILSLLADSQRSLWSSQSFRISYKGASSIWRMYRILAM